MRLLFLAALLHCCTICLDTFAQTPQQPNPATASPMPAIHEKNGRHALFVDGRPFFILGGQAHNSSAWPAMLPKVWQAIKELHANTLD